MRPMAGSPYRALRRAFITACEAAVIDTIARVHPAKGPDGKPLFTDSAALGPRDGTRAALVVAGDRAGSTLLTALVAAGVRPPPGARLVLVHAPDPTRLAGMTGDPAWAAATLEAVATEDLAKAIDLLLLFVGEADMALKSQMAQRFGESNMRVMCLPPGLAPLRRALEAFFAAPPAG